MKRISHYGLLLTDPNTAGTHPLAEWAGDAGYRAYTTGDCLEPGEGWSSIAALATFHLQCSPPLTLPHGHLVITVEVTAVNKGNTCPEYAGLPIQGRPMPPGGWYNLPLDSLVWWNLQDEEWTLGAHIFEGPNWQDYIWINDQYIGLTASPSDPTDTVTLQITAIDWRDESTLDIIPIWTPEDNAKPLPPYCLEAHLAGPDVALTWTNAQNTYTALTLQRSADNGATWEDLELEIQPTAEAVTYTEVSPSGLWWRLVATNAAGSEASEPAPLSDDIREQWNIVAHALGIEDLAEPVAPFRYGEAGELLFLVCCRLWRLGVDPNLPDPVGSDPADWSSYLTSGDWPA